VLTAELVVVVVEMALWAATEKRIIQHRAEQALQ
jgi:hypothetical protein